MLRQKSGNCLLDNWLKNMCSTESQSAWSWKSETRGIHRNTTPNELGIFGQFSVSYIFILCYVMSRPNIPNSFWVVYNTYLRLHISPCLLNTKLPGQQLHQMCLCWSFGRSPQSLQANVLIKLNRIMLCFERQFTCIQFNDQQWLTPLCSILHSVSLHLNK